MWDGWLEGGIRRIALLLAGFGVASLCEGCGRQEHKSRRRWFDAAKAEISSLGQSDRFPPTVMRHPRTQPYILNRALLEKVAKFTFRFSKCLISS